MDQLWRSTMMELKSLIKSFLPGADVTTPPDEQTLAFWRRRYAAGVVAGAHVCLSPDEVDTALAKVK